MKKLGIASLIVGALTAGVVGLAGWAHAGVGHHAWVNNITEPNVYVPSSTPRPNTGP